MKTSEPEIQENSVKTMRCMQWQRQLVNDLSRSQKSSFINSNRRYTSLTLLTKRWKSNVWMLLNTMFTNPISTDEDRLQIPRHWISNIIHAHTNTRSHSRCSHAKWNNVRLKIYVQHHRLMHTNCTSPW